MADLCAGFLQEEYFALLKIVAEFDDRFLLVKGWGVTFSLAALALAFQQKTKGLFLVAALSALSFWVLEATMKVHQVHYYPRMRQIEMTCNPSGMHAPAVDWAWQQGEKLLDGDKEALSGPISEKREFPWFVKTFGLRFGTLWFPHVFLPHVFTVGLGLFFLFRRRQTLSVGEPSSPDQQSSG